MTFHIPYLDSGVHVIVDVVVFQHSVAIVIEINPNLFDDMDEEADEHVGGDRSRFSPQVVFSSTDMWKVCHPTCFPLCILFLLSTGVLPVVTHTPASVLLYTSFSSMTPWPFSCWVTKSCTLHTGSLGSLLQLLPLFFQIKNRHNIYHVYSTVLAVMDLVVSDDWTAVGPDLYSCQGIAVDVISFDEASAIAENINTALVAVENGVAPISRERTL